MNTAQTTNAIGSMLLRLSVTLGWQDLYRFIFSTKKCSKKKLTRCEQSWTSRQ
jgi:hypothetical protein